MSGPSRCHGELTGGGAQQARCTGAVQRPVAPVFPSLSPPLGSVEGLSSPDPVEHGPASQPPSPGPAVSPGPADLDPEAVRGALQEFVQELRDAQRERVRGKGPRREPRTRESGRGARGRGGSHGQGPARGCQSEPGLLPA